MDSSLRGALAILVMFAIFWLLGGLQVRRATARLRKDLKDLGATTASLPTGSWQHLRRSGFLVGLRPEVWRISRSRQEMYIVFGFPSAQRIVAPRVAVLVAGTSVGAPWILGGKPLLRNSFRERGPEHVERMLTGLREIPGPWRWENANRAIIAHGHGWTSLQRDIGPRPYREHLTKLVELGPVVGARVSG